ncbi:MAG: hypothetical protein NTX96_01000 [Candidatus Zambryskibacteria bacterium]|nr:hypothetical protein [Candidatus Zambryskibacteria bacterium]
MAKESVDKEDQDLDWELAVIEELKTCSVDSGSNFHLIRFLKRAAVKKHHDELITAIRYYIQFLCNHPTFSHHVELINEVVTSLERKKREAAMKVADATFVAALNDGEERYMT